MSSTTKIILVLLLVVVLSGMGYGGYYLGKLKNKPTSQSSQSPSPNFSPNPNGPYYHQIYSATSKDGLVWQKQEKLLFDHASVPGAVIHDGIIYLYFVDASAATSEQLSVAISKDNGQTFEKKQKVEIKGSEVSPVDPDPVLLDNGKIRLYYFANITPNQDPAKAEGKHKIYSAESSDGINFENQRLAYEDEQITDPDVFKTESDWRMFVSKGKNMDLAISSDGGLTFSKQSDFSWDKGGVSSTFNFSGIFRTYYCGNGIQSATGGETGKLTSESGLRVQESGKVTCDPSVIQLPDNSYLMFYKVQEMPSQNQPPVNQP